MHFHAGCTWQTARWPAPCCTAPAGQRSSGGAGRRPARGWAGAAGSAPSLGCAACQRACHAFSRNPATAAQASIRGAPGRCHAVGVAHFAQGAARSGGDAGRAEERGCGVMHRRLLCLQTGCTRAYSGENDVGPCFAHSVLEVLKKGSPQFNGWSLRRRSTRSVMRATGRWPGCGTRRFPARGRWRR